MHLYDQRPDRSRDDALECTTDRHPSECETDNTLQSNIERLASVTEHNNNN